MRHSAIGGLLSPLLCIFSSPAHASTDYALLLDGDHSYVTMGQAPSLGATAFTIETWFKRLGAGTTVSSGSGGLSGYPLVTKGRDQNGSEGNNLDCNYFLVVKSSGVIAADFEGMGGGNHPVTGLTVTQDNTWYHAAATYDGAELKIYLNGHLEDQVSTTATPRSDSLQHFALGSGLNSSGVPSGFFAGLLREARVWSYARSQQQIQDGMNTTVTSDTGLLGRWALTDGNGTTVTDTTGNGNTGTLMPGCVWSPQFGPGTHSCLQFGGSDSYVAMGRAPELGLSTFTLECWVKGTGAGQAVGTDAISALPLICKGHHQEDGNTRDANYFLGIKTPENVLAADFEGRDAGTNHPVIGGTRLLNNAWYHVAATYDHSYFRLYLNGQLEAEEAYTAEPRYDSHQHFSIATAMNIGGNPLGFFNGLIDEVRVWNVARTQQQIQDAMNAEAAAKPNSDPALVGHWTFNENTGSVAGDSGTAGVTGYVYNASWTTGAPFPSRLDVSTLAATDVSAQGATFNGAVTDFSGANTAQVHFRWGTSPTVLDQTTPTDSVSAPGGFTATIEDVMADTTYYYQSICETTTGSVEGPVLQFFAADRFGLALYGFSWVGVDDPKLGLKTFTLECWFKRTGPGSATDSGAGGVSGVPLITRGRGISDGGKKDCNYFLAISSGVLAADFEDMASGGNYPVYGITPIEDNVWNHAAATYDGTTWRLYLNGRLDAERAANATPRFDGNSVFAIGSTLDSNWIPEGNFDGSVDEVRVWNYARSRQEIVSTINAQLNSDSGLVGRWGLDEGAGPAASDSSGNGLTGYVSYGTWARGADFDLYIMPDVPQPLAPHNGASVNRPEVDLRVHVADADSDSLQVKFYGRKFRPAPVPPFRIVALPDTQYYSRSYPGRFRAQTQWIVDNRDTLNIAYVAHEGDIVDDAGSPSQWTNANTAISILDTLPDLPYGLCIGNHDENPNGDPTHTNAFNNHFPYTRYQDHRSWYGGHYGNNNDNHYILFRGGEMDFIAIHLKFDTGTSAEVLAWVGGLLEQYPERRAIVVGHSIINGQAAWTKMGGPIYEALKGYPNLFLMLCGHVGTENRRTDGTVHTLLADYQWRDNGGNGWLRILEFAPSDNAINVKTYSPTLNKWEHDDNSEFTLPYDMGGISFTPLSTAVGAGAGADVTSLWTGLEPGRTYEWYAAASDGHSTVAGPAQRFTTPAVRADFNQNGSVDADDFSLFLPCVSGPAVPLSAGCEGKDFDGDNDVDQADFGIFQRCWSGADRPADPNCAS